MNQPFLLPGSASPTPFQPSGRTTPFPLLKIVLALWIVAGLALLGWKMTVRSSKSQPQTSSIPTALNLEDLEHHIDALNNNVNDATGQLRRVEVQIAHAIPGVERNYLSVEKRALENALSALAIARRDLEQSREHGNLIANSIKERTDTK